VLSKYERGRFEDFIISKLNIPELVPNIVNWIEFNLAPDDVFGNKELTEWARNNISYPEEVFDNIVLDEWAEDNGYVKKESE